MAIHSKRTKVFLGDEEITASVHSVSLVSSIERVAHEVEVGFYVAKVETESDGTIVYHLDKWKSKEQ